MSLRLLLLTLIPTAAMAEPFEVVIPEAIVLHVTNHGFDGVGDTLRRMLPASMVVEDLTDTIECDESTSMAYSLSGMELLISVDDVRMVATTGRLDIELLATLDSTAATLQIDGDCSILTGLDETCALQLPTTPLQLNIGMTINQGPEGVEVIADESSVQIQPMTNPLSGCELLSAVGALLVSDSGLISTMLNDAIDPIIADLPATLEPALEDALNGFSFSQDIALGASTVSLNTSPERIEVDDGGMIIGLGATLTGELPSSCVDPGDGPELLAAGWPPLLGTAGSTSFAYDVGIMLSRDLLDTIAWSIWASGTLCMEVADLNGIELTTGMMATFFGSELSELFGSDVPVKLLIRPQHIPHFDFSREAPVLSLAMSGIGVPLIAELDHRQARVLQFDMGMDIGMNVILSDTALNIEVDDPTEGLVWQEVYSELVSPGFSGGVGPLLNLALGQLELIPDDLVPEVLLPDLRGAEIAAVLWEPEPDDSWTGAYLLIDTSNVQAVELPGCSAEGLLGCGEEEPAGMDIDMNTLLGCEEDGSTGCDSGCSSVGVVRVPARLLPVFLVLLTVVGRRRP